MKTQKTRAATFLLLILLPLFLFAQGPMFEEPKDSPGRYFSLSVHYAPAAQTVSLALDPSIPPASERFTFGSLSRDFLKDAGEIWSYPAHIRTRDILPIAGLAVLTGFLIGNDVAIRRGFLDFQDRHPWVRAVSPVISKMGTYGAWGTTAAFLCVGLLAKDSKAVETGALATSAMLQCAVLASFLKGLTGRQRPFWADGIDHWSGPVGFFKRLRSEFGGKYNSFPAGHSITAFSLATVLAMQYSRSVWVPILAYTTAMGVGLSRVTENKHWLSDVLVGGILGHVIGRLVVLNHRSRHHILPATGAIQGTLSFSVTFSLH